MMPISTVEPTHPQPMVKRLCCKLIHHGMMMRIIEIPLLRGKRDR